MADDVATQLRAILGTGAGVGCADPRHRADDLWHQEQAMISRAVPQRRQEFAAGRRAARRAIAELGLRPTAIAAGQDRAPIWPTGLTGSISHCDTLCIAAVSQTHRSIGIDIETPQPLHAELIPIVCTAREREWLQDHPAALRGQLAKRIFCAKEAAFKAQFPLTGRMIGFDALSIRSGRNNLFGVIWQQPIPDLPPLQGKLVMCHGMILACVTI